MQEETIRKVMSYLHDKTREGFSGGVKMGFEYGSPKSIAETLNPDATLPLPDGFNIEEEIKTAFNGDFFGTLFFVYENGKITHFNRIKTMQGKVLEKMFESHPPIKKIAIRRT